MITYETLGDYLWLLKGIAQALDCMGPRAMLYLAAAVSDFYVPIHDMVLILKLTTFYSGNYLIPTLYLSRNIRCSRIGNP